MAYDKQKVIDIALSEVGYLEKATNDQLDDKTANAGKNNYTKYARDLAVYPFYNGSKRGAAWCDVFVDWCFVKAYGLDAAREMTYQPANAAVNYGAGCRYSRQYYNSHDQLHTTPNTGDQIFFYSKDKETIAHTGLVYKVDKQYVYTVEGNTSGSSGIVANGGGVFTKRYMLTNSRIAGYGRPNYGAGENVPSVPATPEKAEKTSKTESVVYNMNTLRIGDTGTQVEVLQWLMIHKTEFSPGKRDGIFGTKTLAAVRQYQQANGLTVDGIVGKKTWAKLLG